VYRCTICLCYKQGDSLYRCTISCLCYRQGNCTDVQYVYVTNKVTHCIDVQYYVLCDRQGDCMDVQYSVLCYRQGDCTDMKGVQVSTVDAFQGGERDVIILSTVRSHACGFIDNDK
jgi:hypothetical protein